MTQKFAIVTVGKTHSGKTTFGRDLEKELTNYVFLETDPIAIFLEKTFSQINENDKSEKRQKNVKFEIFLTLLQSAIENNQNIILGNSNLTKQTRSVVIDLLSNKNYTIIIVYLNYSDSILKERIEKAKKSTKVLRKSKSFKELLSKQKLTIENPALEESQYLFEADTPEKLPKIKEEIIKLVSPG